MNCGARPLAANSFCPACGASTNAQAVICIKCGAGLEAKPEIRTKAGKSKTAAILLAVFLTFWTWLYTYKKDVWKFWVGLALSVVAGIFTFGITAVAIWIWAIVDTSVKNDQWYNSY
jgi:hypothetical protein